MSDQIEVRDVVLVDEEDAFLAVCEAAATLKLNYSGGGIRQVLVDLFRTAEVKLEAPDPTGVAGQGLVLGDSTEHIFALEGLDGYELEIEETDIQGYALVRVHALESGSDVELILSGETSDSHATDVARIWSIAAVIA